MDKNKIKLDHNSNKRMSESDIVNREMLDQLMSMDDDDTHSFSKSLLSEYYIQVDQVKNEIEEALTKGELDDISKKGHYLKGSSANVGAAGIQKICEDIQFAQSLIKDPASLKAFFEKKVSLLKPALESFQEKVEKIYNGEK